MKEFYYNNYPVIKDNDSFDLFQSSYQQFIKDFNNAMIRNGMIKAEVTLPQIDIDNMPKADIQALGNDIGSTSNFPNKFYSEGDLYYTFNDELNSIHPIVLKFSFDYVYVSKLQPNIYQNRGINVGLTIYRKSGDNLIEIIPFTYLSVRFLWVGNTVIQDLITEGLNVVKDNSFINNIPDSILNLSICPRFNYYGTGFVNRYFYPLSDNTNYFYSPIIKFILNRKKDGSIIFTCNNTNPMSGYTIANFYTNAAHTNYANFTYVPSNSNQVETLTPTASTSIFKNSVLEVTDAYNNKELLVFPLEFYSPLEAKVVQNYDLLVASDYRLLPLSFNNGIVKIDIEGIGERDYRVINSKFCQSRFDSTDLVALLVRDE